MTCMKLRFSGFQWRVLTAVVFAWLDDETVGDLKKDLEKYRMERVRYRKLQRKIISEIRRYRRLANDETSMCREVYEAPRSAGSATPDDYLLLERRLELLRRRDDKLKDIAHLREEIMTVEEALFAWSIEQIDFAIQQKNSHASEGVIELQLIQRNTVQGNRWSPMTTKRDEKKAQVVFLQQDLAKVERQIKLVSDEIDEAEVLCRLPPVAAGNLVLLDQCRLRKKLEEDPATDRELLGPSELSGPVPDAARILMRMQNEDIGLGRSG